MRTVKCCGETCECSQDSQNELQDIDILHVRSPISSNKGSITKTTQFEIDESIHSVRALSFTNNKLSFTNNDFSVKRDKNIAQRFGKVQFAYRGQRQTWRRFKNRYQVSTMLSPMKTQRFYDSANGECKPIDCKRVKLIKTSSRKNAYCDKLDRYTGNANRVYITKNCKQVLLASHTLLNIAAFLNFHELVCIRRVNSYFNESLYFKFKIVSTSISTNEKYQIYFKYNNYQMKSILTKILSSLEKIAMWWIHVSNMEMNLLWSNEYGFLFVECGDGNNINETYNSKKESKSRLNLVYLCDIQFNTTYWHRNSTSKTEYKQFKRKHFNNGKNGAYIEQKQPLYHLFKQLKIFQKQSQYIMSYNTSTIFTSYIEYLIIGLHYQILPMISLLKQFLTNKHDFMNNFQFAVNKPIEKMKPIAYFGKPIEYKKVYKIENRLKYFFMHSFNGHGGNAGRLMFVDGKDYDTEDDIYQRNGRYSLFSQLSFTGNFEYYKLFIDNGKDNHINTYGHGYIVNSYVRMMHGMFALFCLYLRLDLLKSLKYNCKYLYQANNQYGLPLLALSFAANTMFLTNIKFFGANTLQTKINVDNITGHGIKNWKHRLQFLYNLCYSSGFHIGLKKYYCQSQSNFTFDHGFPPAVLQSLYSDFNTFVENWQLELYDKEKQKEIHNKFKLIIQMAVGLNDKFVYFDESNQDWKILDGIIVKNDCYVDMMPNDENDVISMYNILTKNGLISEGSILDCLKIPVTGRMFLNMQHIFTLDSVPDLKQFLLNLFSIQSIL